MILKELDPITHTDPLAKAGRRAEEQMAFYLRREFSGDRDRDIRIINDLRLVRGEDVAQIDHLVVHRWGMVIVESKSVTSRVTINDRHEWTRWWNGREQGMPSPVLQGERQGKLLRRLLDDHAEQLVRKVLGFLQVRFGYTPIDVIVAISDDGVIKQPKKNSVPDVLKADQVTGRIRELVEQRRKEASLFSKGAANSHSISPQEVDNICSFLLSQHQPVQTKTDAPDVAPVEIAEAQSPPVAAVVEAIAEPMPMPMPMPMQADSHKCRQCGSVNMAVEYGRYGYYFKCRDCEGNTPIKVECEQCHAKAKIRKSGLEFFVNCEGCGSERVFWKN